MTQIKLDPTVFEFITIKIDGREFVFTVSDFERIEFRSEYSDFNESWSLYHAIHRRGKPIISVTLVMNVEQSITFEGVDIYTLTMFKEKTRHEKLAELVRKHYQN